MDLNQGSKQECVTNQPHLSWIASTCFVQLIRFSFFFLDLLLITNRRDQSKKIRHMLLHLKLYETRALLFSSSSSSILCIDTKLETCLVFCLTRFSISIKRIVSVHSLLNPSCLVSKGSIHLCLLACLLRIASYLSQIDPSHTVTHSLTYCIPSGLT